MLLVVLFSGLELGFLILRLLGETPRVYERGKAISEMRLGFEFIALNSAEGLYEILFEFVAVFSLNNRRAKS